jgi:superfamily II DNA helicase RecQ
MSSDLAAGERTFDVLAVFPIGFGKSIVYQSFVMPKSRLISNVNKSALAFVISLLKSIVGEQLKILVTLVFQIF